MRPTVGLYLTLAAAGSSAWGQAAEPVALEPVVVTAERSRQTTFDAPASITAVNRSALENAGPQVNLSEALDRVPGISVLNRQNYAQDLQLSIRGFGSRSTFGIRGVRLIVDGIPATTPDGQGQASSIVLSSASRIEVLRGPLAQLYGNAAGGVVQVFTETDAAQPTSTMSAYTGRFGERKVGWKFGSSNEVDSVTLDWSHFRTSGYREHSAASRDQFNAKWQHDGGPDTRVSVIVNGLDQPISQDPLGLTRAQWEADPVRAVDAAKTQDTRKSVGQVQIGTVLEQRLGANTTLTARIYFGERDLDNALSVPLAAQQAATSAGGIVSFTRGYSGLGLQVSHAAKFGEAIALRLVGGVEADHMNESRRGFINAGGVQGALKRNERNEVDSADVFAQGSLDLGSDWTVTTGARASRVKFQSTDFFIVGANPDDSGSVDYHAVNPVLGVTWRVGPALNLYANVGRGFETPTLTEMSYRAVGTGLNTDLRAARSRHAELGSKWKLAPGHRLDLAVFDIRTVDELVVDTNVGGRSTYKNAGRTGRRGAELAYLGQFGDDWQTVLSASLLRARFSDGFVSGSGAAAVSVPAGNRLPGTPDRSAYAELAWAPARAWAGLNAGVEFVHTGKLYVNDVNSDAAPAASVLNLRAGLSQRGGGWTFTERVRVDNATDKRYAGSVIVNEGNQRYFEPALPRNWLFAFTAKVEF